MSNNENSMELSDSSSMQSPKERKSRLKRVLSQTLVLQELINDSTIIKLDEAINEADSVSNETSIHEKVNNQQEVLMDSQLMATSSKVLKICTSTLTTRMRDYDHVDFANKLIKYMQAEASEDSQPPNWSLLETRVAKLVKRTPYYSTFLGALEPLEKKVVVRKSHERKASQAAMIRPEKLAPSANNKEEDSVERTVRKIRKLISSYYKEEEEPLDFFQLILNPNDFGRTIRNLLYISFLVKDGIVKLLKDDRGRLVVQPRRKEANSKERGDSNGESIQNVISLNMQQWKILKDAYRLEQPMIDFDEDK